MLKMLHSFTYSYTGLSRRLTSPVYFIVPNKEPVMAKALWDTGATISAITPEIREQLGLPTVDRITAIGANSTSRVDVVHLSIELPNQIIVDDIDVAVCTFNHGIGMIIGMDVITMGDFAICNAENQTQFSFTIPPLKDKINFTKLQP
jgi:predicted aspartyl protease